MSRSTHSDQATPRTTMRAVAGTEARSRQGRTQFRGVCLDQGCHWRGQWTDQVTALHDYRGHRQDAHANRVAVVTFDGPERDRPGTYRVHTRMGHTVVHHQRLTPAEHAEVMANPTLAHRRQWSIVSNPDQHRRSQP